MRDLTLSDTMERRNAHLRREQHYLMWALGRTKSEAERYVRAAGCARRMARMIGEEMRRMRTEHREEGR